MAILIFVFGHKGSQEVLDFCVVRKNAYTAVVFAKDVVRLRNICVIFEAVLSTWVDYFLF